MKPSVSAKLASLDERLHELDRLLADPGVVNDLDNYRKLTREHAELTPVVEGFRSDLGDALTKREGAHRREAGRSELPTTPGG